METMTTRKARMLKALKFSAELAGMQFAETDAGGATAQYAGTDYVIIWSELDITSGVARV